jgi:hypothetical protein
MVSKISLFSCFASGLSNGKRIMYEGIGQSLHPEPDGTVPHIGVSRFLNWIVVDIDDLIEVARHNAVYLIQALKVESAILIHILWQGKWRPGYKPPPHPGRCTP